MSMFAPTHSLPQPCDGTNLPVSLTEMPFELGIRPQQAGPIPSRPLSRHSRKRFVREFAAAQTRWSGGAYPSNFTSYPGT
jgi:hypothetical protein